MNVRGCKEDKLSYIKGDDGEETDDDENNTREEIGTD